MKITKAVFPVAGLGTRFLPATKASPKEMLPVVDKPLIQYAVEEALSAGITELIFVTSNTKRAIEDHFDSNYELEQKLQSQEKWELLNLVRGVLPKQATCLYIRQPEALGLGHAILCARAAIGNEPFAVLLADDLIDTESSEQPCLGQLISCYEALSKRGEAGSVLAVQKVNPDETDKYGIVELEEPVDKKTEILKIKNIVEKPDPKEAKSNLGVVGRYILSPAVLLELQNLQKGRGGEYQLTDALAHVLGKEPVYAYAFQGKRYDCGDKLGYLQAIVSLGLKHPEFGAEFQNYLKNLEY
ncbi:MAG: UTP--glucose-1-phosphate uridylyltransferase GalU [Gammaproteobacteria bacterium]